jgi:hypothetical protein
MIGISRMRGITSRTNTSQRTNSMDDRVWTTETEDAIVEAIQGRARVRPEERISDGDARTLLHEQMRRRIEAIQERERERRNVERWQERERNLRDRMLREDRRRQEIATAERERQTIGFLQDFLDGKMPEKKKEKEKILKPLPDELFEI